MASTIDGARVQVVDSYLVSALEQARRTLIRTAFNPVIYEVLDFGISLYDGDLALVAEAPGILSFLGANDRAIRYGVEHVGRGNLRPGDIVLMNYPYWSSAHAYDACLFAPIHLAPGEEPTHYLAVRAHWMDLGAKDAAYVLDSTDMHQEGLIFPGTKLVKGGVIDEELIDLVRFNSRLPEITIGDFHAQVAAIRTAERRLREIAERFGLETMTDVARVMRDRGRRAALAALEALPHGTWEATEWLDDDGITDDMLRMHVRVTITADRFVVDYSGSADAAAGPVNMPLGATEAMVKGVFKAMTTPGEHSNAGHFDVLEVVVPPGNLFHAVYPAPTFTLWTAFGAFELIHKALAPAIPWLHASSGADEPGFMATGPHQDTGLTYVISNNEGIGWGASQDHDGSTALQHPSTGVVRNTPIEVLEHKAALLHERVELRQDSAGAGRHRGGLGVRRDVRFTMPGEVLSMKKKTRTRPWGLRGGHDAETNGMLVYPETDRSRWARMQRFAMDPGDRFWNFSGGGGGYGDPLDRDPARVVDDVRNGYVSVEAARDIYGIVVNDDGVARPTEARSRRQREDVPAEDERAGGG
jgi:N-methylhydantoinase B